MKVTLEQIEEALKSLGSARRYYRLHGYRPRAIVFMPPFEILPMSYMPNPKDRRQCKEVVCFPNPKTDNWEIDI